MNMLCQNNFCSNKVQAQDETSEEKLRKDETETSEQPKKKKKKKDKDKEKNVE